MDVRRSTRPRMVKKKSDIVYFDDQRIELTDQEKDLIYPKEKRYCFCKRTEEEAVGLTMIECDNCHDWFHDECIGRRSEELELLEVYYCPSCSSNRLQKCKKPQPSVADIELLLTALAELDEEKPKNKKKEPKVQPAKIAVFHLSEPIQKYPGLVGFIRNESSSLQDDNKSIVPIYRTDLDKGTVWTSWGTYRIGVAEGKIQACSDCRGVVRSGDSCESPGMNRAKVARSEGFLKIEEADLTVELPQKNYRFEFEMEKAERVMGMVGCSEFGEFKEYVWNSLKSKSLRELFYSS